MKKLGQSDRGGVIVELTSEECKSLDRLAMAVEGVGIWDMRAGQFSPGVETDISTAIRAVTEFAINKGHINALLTQLRTLDNILMLQDEP